MAFSQMVAAVPFYAGLTLEGIGPKGVRWQERDAASAFPRGETPSADSVPAAEPAPALTNGALRLGTFRSIWAAPEVEVSPALKFLHPRQRLEISPADAQRLGLRNGERVRVGSNGTRVNATVALRAATPPGSVFLEEGVPEDGANLLTTALVEVEKA
jgi:NADH-quinone oxidoreductase subunit G